jgi:glycosyltransferase involved in cell wall biosynthesis
MRKKRVLFLTEATYLSTGYATYAKQILDRLYDSGKYEIAEFSIYGAEDAVERKGMRWKNYPNMPDKTNKKETEFYSSSPEHQFGSWRFEQVCLDFKADVVLLIRDYWMDSFVYKSPYRRIFKSIWMPTVDAYPQNKEWLHVYGSMDGIITYSDWALDSLKKQMTDSTNFLSAAPPSASECFKPLNKEDHKRKLGMDPSMNIIGTVMRNQRRKLFPALFEAFGKYLKKTKDTKTFLYCHTSYPDNGWDIGTLLHENEISSRVIFSYMCKSCNNLEICKFHDACKQCSACNRFSSLPVSVSNGVSSETLSEIYNLFDLYVQCASSEGFGLPQVEAAACGVPIATVDYSAMSDIVSKLNADPIKYTLYKELETGCDRAVVDPDALADYFEKFFSKPLELIKKKGMETKQAFDEHYSWDKSAKVWMDAVDSMPFADWSTPPKIKDINNEKPPENISNKGFIEWAMSKYADETKVNSYFARSLLRDLNMGRTKGGFGGYFYSDMSAHGKIQERPINRETVLKMIKEMGKLINHWENIRNSKNG